jgi:hypothetical protein
MNLGDGCNLQDMPLVRYYLSKAKLIVLEIYSERILGLMIPYRAHFNIPTMSGLCTDIMNVLSSLVLLMKRIGLKNGYLEHLILQMCLSSHLAFVAIHDDFEVATCNQQKAL